MTSAWGGLKTGPPRRHQIQPVEGPVLDPRAKETYLKRGQKVDPLEIKSGPPWRVQFWSLSLWQICWSVYFKLKLIWPATAAAGILNWGGNFCAPAFWDQKKGPQRAKIKNNAAIRQSHHLRSYPSMVAWRVSPVGGGEGEKGLKPPWSLFEALLKSPLKPFSSPLEAPLKPQAPFKPPRGSLHLESPLQAPFTNKHPSKPSPSSPLRPSQAPLKPLKPFSSLLQASFEAFPVKPPWSPSQAPLKAPWSPSQAPLEAPLHEALQVKPPWSALEALLKPPLQASHLQAPLKPFSSPWSPSQAPLKPRWSRIKPRKPPSSPPEAPVKPPGSPSPSQRALLCKNFCATTSVP